MWTGAILWYLHEEKNLITHFNYLRLSTVFPWINTLRAWKQTGFNGANEVTVLVLV